ncbi:MAG: TIM barrel protein [Lachnospiraceae bacterium]|nr:TIM barrel protein [Lachnospiraceae bacterium]
MKIQFNITTSECDLERYESSADLESMMGSRFDGVELMCFEDDVRGIIRKEKVTGLHMTNIMHLYDFWRGDMETLLRQFEKEENIIRHYGGLRHEDLIAKYKKDIENALKYEAEYVVFHVASCTDEEEMANVFNEDDFDVLDAHCELLNELFPADWDGPRLLLENLWLPGFDFTKPDRTKYMLDHVNYKKKGIMLDTGHLMHTNLDLRDMDEAVEYVHQMLDLHGDLCKYIKGVHLQGSVTGDIVKKAMKEYDGMPADYGERNFKLFMYVFQVDRHKPFIAKGVKELIERIAPDYLTFEFISESREQHEGYLNEQWSVLEGLRR